MGGSTVFVFDIELSDVDRGVYEALSLKVAQHPSESDTYLVTRVLAYCLEYTEGIGFTLGLSDADEPPIAVTDLTGRRVATIEVGTPDPARLHKATKATERVVVYCHKDPQAWLRALGAAKIYAPERLTGWQLERAAVDALAESLQRRNRWSLSRTEDTLYIDGEAVSVVTPLERLPL